MDLRRSGSGSLIRKRTLSALQRTLSWAIASNKILDKRHPSVTIIIDLDIRTTVPWILAEIAVTKSSLGRIKRREERRSSRGQVRQGSTGFGTSPISFQLSAEKLGVPGSLIALHVVPQFSEAPHNDLEILTDNSERDFETAALLSKIPGLDAPLESHFTEANGGSYFVFAPTRIAVDTPWGTVTVRKNARGEASMVKMNCRARSAIEALDHLQLACSAFLDNWAYEATAPVYLTRLRAYDLAHKSEVMRVTVPFRQMEINPSASQIPTPLRPILSLYREGLGSASAIYKFLCFYKILEGYFKRLKPDLAKIFRKASLPYPMPNDTVPFHQDLDAKFGTFVGQSITEFQNHLAPGFRDAVAHFEKDGLSPLIMSNPTEIFRFSVTALAVELCCRTVIESYRSAFKAAVEAGLDLSSLAEKSEIPSRGV